MTKGNDPVAVFREYEKRLNGGDIDAVMELFDDGVVTSEMIVGMFPGGRHLDALRRYINETVIEKKGVITTTRVATADDWVYAVAEVESELLRGLGVERIRGIDELEVKDNRITSFRFLPDVTDPLTQKFVKAVLGAPDGAR